MLEKFLNKEEKKLFSKRNLKRIKKEDFFSYLEMEESLLESLKSKLLTDDVKNPILEAEVENQQLFVDHLNKYYYEVVLLEPNTKTEEVKIFEKELNKIMKPINKIQKKGPKW
ncbi:hypothetical protein SGLAD_v1c05340 [Spiroplasma gladiatoris]|uniref:Uncharacterized protein n=1 Tax=Spiroplasma gladiatoris TaxID=2143 RepID=A0A4P7AJ25_9MOLU|nr:hypothetical protein [Spiroplasma gladiatoris]QBQ07733.1 hypothetical protein SGLAD_v1c05340 [Spiroplasma gladiatoris]